MNRILDECREFIRKLYKSELGISIGDDFSHVMRRRVPAWRIVALSDLTTTATGDAECAGLVLDPEIGLMLYFVPFESEMELRPHITHALSVRSFLREDLPEGPLADDRDPWGAWRVAIHWLVPERSRGAWVRQIADLRHQTGFSEEVVFDIVEYGTSGIEPALKKHGLPRLLMTCRSVIRKTRSDETFEWMSADAQVRKALVGFDKSFQQADQAALAKEIVREVNDYSYTGRADAPHSTVAKGFDRFHVESFRNLSSVDISFGGMDQAAYVIHGPNGSGKSSVIEALSLSLFKTSERFERYTSREEKDIPGADRAITYLRRYVSPIDRPNAIPRFSFDGGLLAPFALSDSDNIRAAREQLSGTILTQEETAELARLGAGDLAVRVLGEFSGLADHITESVSGFVGSATADRQELLRAFGLNSAITRIDTALPRIVQQNLLSNVPTVPLPLVHWLEGIGPLDPRCALLASRWRNWRDPEILDRLASDISGRAIDTASCKSVVHTWLSQYNDLLVESSAVGEDLKRRCTGAAATQNDIGVVLNQWGTWIEGRAPQMSQSTPLPRDAAYRSQLEVRLAEVLLDGREATTRIDFLAKCLEFVIRRWSSEHSAECPTCGSDVAERGGIVTVIESVHRDALSVRDRLRQEHDSLKLELDALGSHISNGQKNDCPVPPMQQELLRNGLSWLIPAGVSFDHFIGERPNRQSLAATVTNIMQGPPVPPAIDLPATTDALVNSIVSAFERARAVFKRPDDWAPVQKKLAELVAKVVSEHLPNTLERLWQEIALCLTPAPWLLPGKPTMHHQLERKQQRVSLRVRDRLARYVLNQAEIHTLGLAWFFTRFLTSGRFHHGLLILDDAAQEQDQTTFRDFCRFLETLLRLHHSSSQPIKLIATLNQETRAVELARATRGNLAVLDWESTQDRTIREIDVIGPGFIARSPLKLFDSVNT